MGWFDQNFRRKSISRHIKVDLRNVADHCTTIEIIRVTEYPNVPTELVANLQHLKDHLFRLSWRINYEEYRDDFTRYCVAIDLNAEADNLDWFLKELRLITDDELDYFW